ncbi:MAG: acetyl-CoA carboxylase biotin carboxyl carrier protein subunit [Saprospiraceae bacterium]
MESSFKATVNNQFEFDVNNLAQLDIVSIDDFTFHILKNGEAIRAEIVQRDFVKKQFTIKINGNAYDIKLADEYDQLVKKLGLTTAVAYKVKDVKAPMPGLVVGVNVEVGQSVTRGDALLILEAMKMENVLKSPGDGVVKAIRVSKGMAVDKGAVLIEME